jgi:hypothetical protein
LDLPAHRRVAHHFIVQSFLTASTLAVPTQIMRWDIDIFLVSFWSLHKIRCKRSAMFLSPPQALIDAFHADVGFTTIWALGETVEIVWNSDGFYMAPETLWSLTLVSIDRGYGYGESMTLCG